MKGISSITKKSIAGRKCAKCKSNKTHFGITRYGTRNDYWYFHDGKFYCLKCDRKYFRPKRDFQTSKHYTNLQLVFNGKRIYLKAKPRKGICSLCKKKIGDSYIAWRNKRKIIKETHMHHFADYHNDNPLRDTIEVCASCHKKEYWKNRL